MKRRSFLKTTSIVGFISFISPLDLFHFAANDYWLNKKEFASPPSSALAQVFWFWMNGNVTKQGITLDLEAMKKIGVGGVFNFDVGTGIPKGPIVYLSEEWIELKKHAIREANRLELEFTMHNCPGWSSSGGPWMTPELAMQQLTWSEAYVKGGSIEIHLPKPPDRLNYYRDLAVIAYPSLEREDLLQTVKIHSSNGEYIHEPLNHRHQEEGMIVYPAKENDSCWLQFEFTEPYEVKLLTFYLSAIRNKDTKDIPLEFGERTSIFFEASDDGLNFWAVTPINTGLETELLLGDKFIAFDIPPTSAKYFRFTSAKARRYRQVQLSGITRLKNWMEKTNNRARNNLYVEETSTIDTTNDQKIPPRSIINLDSVIDVTSFVNNEGLLKWNAPEGNWTILRIGFTATGTLNRAAPETGVGLECDKYNKSALQFHFNKMMEHFLPVIGPLTAQRKMGLEIDSYEAGTQNWTPGFESIFKNSCRYDLKKYLPVLTGGRIIGDVAVTERFLWDLRKVQAELIADNYYGYFHQLCKQHGITAYTEPYDSGPMEEMQIGSRVDSNMGEFWTGVSSVFPAQSPVRRTLKLAASISHINNQKIIGAEAFTAEPDSSRWQEYPFALKAVGDKAFVKGVNRLVIHRFAHQPHPEAKPGMTMGPWGIHFDRTNTWWNQSKAWLQYLARCQHMLQQGKFVADLVYFTGEDANMYTRVVPDELTPSPPEGYDYDLINAETIFKSAKIVNRQLTLSNGASYKIFVLQNYKALTLPLLQQIREMVKEGMLLVGSKPERSAGLMNYSNNDASFKAIADEVWGDSNGSSITEKSFGKGHVYWGKSLLDILQANDIKKDFEYTSRSGDAPIIFTHRKTNEAEIYFLSNQRRSFEELVCTFRVKGKQPELWDAATGKIITIPIYHLVDDRVKVPIQLEPCGSVFVVFKSAASSEPFMSVEKDGTALLSTKDFDPCPRKLYKEVVNNFTISFWAKPEINILLNPVFIMGSIGHPWTEFYAIYPPSGSELHGEGHVTCGVTVGRNGIAVWENASDTPVLVLPAPVAISGWSHVSIVYENGTPSIYLNGKIIQKGKKSSYLVHPAPDKNYLSEGASYYNGDMTEPILYNEVLSEDQIPQLARKKASFIETGFEVEIAANKTPALLIKKNGKYTIKNSDGKASSFSITDIEEPLEIKGSWQVNFPANTGAPSQIVLPELISLHKHSVDSVKYFSGTATYIKTFSVSKTTGSKNYFLDLGRVEVIAEVKLNGKDFGILWKRPYRIDITSALKQGLNNLEIKLTNLWPNRLIGDEQLPDPDKFTPGGASSGLEGLTGGYIENLPDWFIQGKPQPKNGRVTFTTWKHYITTSPLLESGLIGPITIQQGVIKLL